MRSESTPKGEEYLKLAVKVINESASANEKARLGRLLKAKPELEADFEGLKRELLEDAGDDFAEILLKSIAGKATPEEHQELQSLKTEDRARWSRCLAFGLTLQVVAESLQKARTSPPPRSKMPDHIRERLLGNLRKARKS